MPAVAESSALSAASLGIELGSTRIKACLIGADGTVLALGGHEWENQFVDRMWTYSLDDVWSGLRAAYADLAADAHRRHGAQIETLGAIGVSAMMHGYLAFDKAAELLVPFRTWRNTTTGAAAEALTTRFGTNIPLRWSIAHLYQAILDEEAHVPRVRFLTTLAGYVHWQLTGQRVLGIGDASGMFPIDDATRDYDRQAIDQFDRLVVERVPEFRLAEVLPAILPAGEPAGNLTDAGALLLDPSGALRAGIAFCPPEGDAGTGMVATCSIAPKTGNVSAGTSIFAMVVLERPLAGVHDELDLVTTPAGDAVAMVHCNNGASEIAAWADVFGEFAAAVGAEVAADRVFEVLFLAALEGEPDAGGLVAYNYLAGEPITQLTEGRPLFVRTPDSRLTLANFMRAQLFGSFGTLAIGMRVLEAEGVTIERMLAHGGIFRTAGVAQRLLAAAIGAPVAVAATASEGGAWGMAVLASFMTSGHDDLDTYLREVVFGSIEFDTVVPDATDVAGFGAFLQRYSAGLAVERAATESL